MTAAVIMPQLGETVAEGKILAWFKAVGDRVNEGDNLFEVETDKVTLEVQSTVAGRLDEIRVGVGVTAKVGAVVAVVGGGATQAAAAPAPAVALSPFEEVVTPTENFGRARQADGVRLTPLARRLIAQNGLDAAALAASARQQGLSRIDERAVRAAMAAKPAPEAQGEVVTLNAVRARTAERLTENWRTIPHVFQAIEIDFTALDRARQQHKQAFQTANGFSLTYLPFIARAACLAIAAFPLINARYADKALTPSRGVHLGVAVDLAHNGLVVPVVRDAGDLTLIGLAKAINRMIDKARNGKLAPDDLAGATYTISNNGAFGTTLTAPIINAPQVAILSSDAIRMKPAVISTAQGDFIAARLIGMLGQSFDHRAFDGAYSAAFLSRLKEILEQRNWGDEL